MTDTETLVTLSPSAEMTELLGELTRTLERLKRIPRPAAKAAAFDDLPVVAHARAMRLFLAASRTEDRSPSELLHHLSQELGIMSAKDLHARFRTLSEGSGVASLWRGIQSAASPDALLKNDMALGWGGFETMPAKDSERRGAVTRRRMMTDYFRDAVDWTQLRALDLTNAAALILDAVDAEMFVDEQAAWWLKRVSVEASVRAANWNEWAASLLFGRVFSALAVGVEEAREVIRRDGAVLEELLQGPWQAMPWPRVKNEAGEITEG